MEPNLSVDFRHAWQAALAWITQHESLFIFLAILVEEAGVPMPVPADLAMALAGYRVSQGQMTLLEAFLIGQSATLIGSSILYWIGRRGGRALLFRYGRLLRLDAHRIGQMERLVTRLGPLAIIVGRQIPGLRLAAPLACGVFCMPYWVFLPAMFAGASIYIAIFIVVGMWGGPAAISAFHARVLPLRFLASSVLLLLAALLLRRLSRHARDVVAPEYRRAAARRQSLEAALIAGIGASAVTALSITWLLELISLVARTPPEQALIQFLESDVTPALVAALSRYAPHLLVVSGFIATLPLQVAGHVAWALIYAFFAEQRLRGSASFRGLQFALFPWLFSALVVFPLLDAGPFGYRLGGVVPIAGDLLRNLIFGASLGTIYRLVRLARQPRHHKGTRHGHRHRHGGATLQLPTPAQIANRKS